ncbi:unnamed protein product, partial [Polarella glacialis]
AQQAQLDPNPIRPIHSQMQDQLRLQQLLTICSDLERDLHGLQCQQFQGATEVLSQEMMKQQVEDLKQQIRFQQGMSQERPQQLSQQAPSRSPGPAPRPLGQSSSSSVVPTTALKGSTPSSFGSRSITPGSLGSSTPKLWADYESSRASSKSSLPTSSLPSRLQSGQFVS